MTPIWILVCSLFILLGVEIRIRVAFEKISEWKYGMDRLGQEIKNLQNEIAMLLKDGVKHEHRYKI